MGLTRLHSLQLQHNHITTVPQTLFTNNAMQSANRGTVLHGNPLDDSTRQRMNEYRQRTRIFLGGEIPGITHTPVDQQDVTPWLDGVPIAEHPQRIIVWDQLKSHESAMKDNAFRVLADLTKAQDYKNDPVRRPLLIARVWRLLNAMAQSSALRDDIFAYTFEAGTCGDGAILLFMDMELWLKKHEAVAQPSSNQANKALKELLDGEFYMKNLDEFALAHLADFESTLAPGEREPDHAEVRLYLRLKLAKEFNLPIQPENRLYSPGAALTREHLTTILQLMRDLKTTDAAKNALLNNELWIKYLMSCVPEPFATIENTSEYKLALLRNEGLDYETMQYQERRRSINTEKDTERSRLVNQLTQAILIGGGTA